MKKVAIVFGTRPEIIKLFPVYKALKKDFNCQLIHTGQHSTLASSQLNIFKLKPFLSLDIMTSGQSQSGIFKEISEKFGDYLSTEKPDMVVTQGDTATAFFASVLAFTHKIPVAHIEAGLRTYNLESPFPEEGYRQMISRVAYLNFCPTETSKNNLITENIPIEKIFVVGNPVIDTLEWLKKQKISQSEYVKNLLSTISKRKIILITQHRRENFGSSHKRILQTIKSLANTFDSEAAFVFPVHPNPQIKDRVEKELNGVKNIFLVEPLDYFDFISLMKVSNLIISDSGGIQEEAPTFGLKVLVTRETTERPEGVLAGTSIIVGSSPRIIKSEFIKCLKNFNKSKSTINPFGDGKASERISKIISEFYEKQNKI